MDQTKLKQFKDFAEKCPLPNGHFFLDQQGKPFIESGDLCAVFGEHRFADESFLSG